jgi:hypothetical protein
LKLICRIKEVFLQNILDEGHYIVYIQIQVGSALTETENWDLLVDCTSRDGRKMLDAGVHISDKRTLLKKKHRPLLSLKSVFDFFIILERSETQQDKFESILEIIESVVSSPFVKAEADSDRIFCTVFETVCASSLAICT